MIELKDKKIIRVIQKDSSLMHLTWMINNICNNKCTYCLPELNSGKGHHYKWENAKKFLELLFEKYPKIHCSVTGGEPSISHFFPELVKFFNSNSTADAYKNQYFYYGSNVSALTSYGYELNYTAVWTGSVNSRQYDAGIVNLSEVRIYDYASTTKWKQAQMISSSLVTSASAIFFAGSGHAQWRNTSAITSITYDTSFSATHNILAGSKIMLFGIKRYGQ